MGSTRSLKREQLKQQYSRFCLAWQNEKRYQQYLLDNDEKLEEGHHELGRKPTFRMWLTAVKNRKISARVGEPPPAEIEKDPKKVEVVDPDWE